MKNELEIEVLVFLEGGKLEYPEKNPRSRNGNQQQTQPTYDAGSGNRTQDTLVGGECSEPSLLPRDVFFQVTVLSTGCKTMMTLGLQGLVIFFQC